MSEEPPVIRASLSEAEGRAVLKTCFEQAGFAIREDVQYDVAGTTVGLDGYDAAARVGYEYLTSEAGDRAEITPAVLAGFEDRMRQGELYLLLVDERRVDAAGLELAAQRFLARVAQLRGGSA